MQPFSQILVLIQKPYICINALKTLYKLKKIETCRIITNPQKN